VFGISSSEFIVLVVVAAVVLGPERLPQYAQQLGRLIRELRRMAQGASEQVKAELGPDFDDVDWRKLDPRQYDPRRIVREALSETLDPDDPLGLNALRADVLRADKPVSGGGPGGRHAARPDLATGPSTGASAGASVDVPFDPDAT
jgi:sec-independent protein translocase protein TatB